MPRAGTILSAANTTDPPSGPELDLFAATFDSLPASIAVLDSTG